MSGEVVPLKPSTDAEADVKKRLLKWRDELAEQVLQAVRTDAALHFLDNVDDDEETSTFDLRGAYDPIVVSKTGARLSDAIADFAEEIGRSEKELRRLYESTLRAKWKTQKQATTPIEPTGKRYGRNYLVNVHGVWTRLDAGGADLYVWRRIARTRIDHAALSHDTTAQRNWRHHYLITDETGEFQVSIGNEKLSKDAGSAISFLIKHGIHVVESKDARQHLAIFLRYKPHARIIRAPRTGWFEVRKGSWVFVLPDETLVMPRSPSFSIVRPTNVMAATDSVGLEVAKNGASGLRRRLPKIPTPFLRSAFSLRHRCCAGPKSRAAASTSTVPPRSARRWSAQSVSRSMASPLRLAPERTHLATPGRQQQTGSASVPCSGLMLGKV